MEQKRLHGLIELIVLAVLSAITIAFGIIADTSTLGIISSVVLNGLIILAIWLLYKEKHYAASYSILLLLVFGNGLINLFNFIYSFQFSSKEYLGVFNWTDVVLAVGGIYLTALIIYYLSKEGFKFNRENFKFDQLMIFFPIFIYLHYSSIEMLIFVAVVEFIAINYKKLSSLSLMLSKTLVSIFFIISLLIKGTIANSTAKDWLVLLIAIYTIVLIILKAIPYIKKEFSNKKKEELQE